MPEEDEFSARREAQFLADAYGSEAALYAALKAQRAIDRRDYRRCAKWKRVLEILSSDSLQSVPNNHH
ncbi:MAG: hypothetical protein AB7I79_14260 [Rhizobiaceae bacterium]